VLADLRMCPDQCDHGINIVVETTRLSRFLTFVEVGRVDQIEAR